MTTGTLVDSNVVIDVLTEDQRWFEWSSAALARAAEAGPLFINPVVYAEVSVQVQPDRRARRRPPAV